MEIQQIILIIISLLLLYWVVKFITKTFFKIFLFFVIIIIGVFGFWYFSKTNIFDTMSKLFCNKIENNNENNLKCNCFVLPIQNHFEGRLTPSERESIKKDPIKSLEEFKASYKATEKEITSCFEKNGESSGIIDDIKNDIKQHVVGFSDFF